MAQICLGLDCFLVHLRSARLTHYNPKRGGGAQSELCFLAFLLVFRFFIDIRIQWVRPTAYKSMENAIVANNRCFLISLGGGDLNLKKSWHPSTFKNQERLWKLEKKHAEEQTKIEQMKKELQEERQLLELQKLQEDAGAR